MSNQKLFLFIVVSVCFVFLGFLGIKLLNNSQNHNIVVKNENKDKIVEKKLAINSEKQDDNKKSAVELITSANNDETSSHYKEINFNSDVLLQELLDSLSLDMKDVENGQKQFEEDAICIEWDARINRKIGDKLSEEQKGLMRQNHLIALYIKDQADLNYLENSEISHKEYKENLALVFKWHQKTYQEILSEEEYEQLFEVSADETDDIVDGMVNTGSEIEIINPESTMDDVYQIVPIHKIEKLTMLFKERQLGARSIGEAVNAGEISVEEAGEVWNGYYQDYIDGAEDLLDAEEFELIFGYPKKIKE